MRIDATHADEDGLIRDFVTDLARSSGARMPDLEDLRRQARMRRRRAMRTGAIAATACAVGASLAGWGVAAQWHSPEPQHAAASGSEFKLPTVPDELTGLEAQIVGSLRFTDADGCPYLAAPQDGKTHVYLNFPAGYTGRVNAEGSREVLDETGVVVATEGGQVEIDGGSAVPVENGVRLPYRDWVPSCHPDEPQYAVSAIRPVSTSAGAGE